MDRDELLGREDEAWAGFVDAFAAVSEDRRDVPGAVPGWSVKDLVWHCGYWADYAGDLLERMTAGQPAPPDQDWDEVNRLVMEDGRGMSWDEVVVAAERGRDRAREALIAMPDVTESAASEFGGETFEHYDEHAAEITAFSAAS